jgi:hypothetical protein
LVCALANSLLPRSKISSQLHKDIPGFGPQILLRHLLPGSRIRLYGSELEQRRSNAAQHMKRTESCTTPANQDLTRTSFNKIIGIRVSLCEGIAYSNAPTLTSQFLRRDNNSGGKDFHSPGTRNRTSTFPFLLSLKTVS